MLIKSDNENSFCDYEQARAYCEKYGLKNVTPANILPIANALFRAYMDGRNLNNKNVDK